MFNVGPIRWKSRRQDSVVLSTSDAEYMTSSECVKEVVYIGDILQDFGFTQIGPTNHFEDNPEEVTMSFNPVRHRGKYSRDIDIHRHYVRELALAASKGKFASSWGSSSYAYEASVRGDEDCMPSR
jgi:hypothetical protein